MGDKMIDNSNILAACTLCPRLCGVNRCTGQRGVCGQTNVVKAARAGLHMWEEPCISGTRGSGTVFFSGCSLHCVFCQNAPIANGTAGKEISVERLAEIFLELQEKGANNINLVTPGHFVPQIRTALDKAKAQGLVLPVVYNTGSYESLDTIQSLEGYVDVYLPDFKYMSEEISGKYSHATDYFKYASAAIAEMVRQTKEPRFVSEQVVKQSAERGTDCWKRESWMTAEELDAWKEMPESVAEDERVEIMVRGTIVRHLLLPGCLEDSKNIIKYLLETHGDAIYISLMNQYTPPHHVPGHPELEQKVTPEDYDELVDYAIELGINYGFVQEGETAEESFISAFDGEGI